MIRMDQYDVLERQREKQRLRDQDDHELRNGAASLFDLAQSNGFFSGLAVARARIGRRGVVRI